MAVIRWPLYTIMRVHKTGFQDLCEYRTSEEFFQCSSQDTVQVQIDDDVGNVEANPHNQDGHEDARSVSVGLVVPDDGSVLKFKGRQGKKGVS